MSFFTNNDFWSLNVNATKKLGSLCRKKATLCLFLSEIWYKMAGNQIRFLFCILLIIEAFKKISFAEILVAAQTQIEQTKFNALSEWTIDAINRNKDYSSCSIFWFKQNASCFVLKMEPTTYGFIIEFYIRNQNKQINRSNTIVKTFSAVVDGKRLIFEKMDIDDRGCPDLKEVHLVFTDYLNIIVLLGYDVL